MMKTFDELLKMDDVQLRQYRQWMAAKFIHTVPVERRATLQRQQNMLDEALANGASVEENLALLEREMGEHLRLLNEQLQKATQLIKETHNG